jgi:putative Holliday junction resolvase
MRIIAFDIGDSKIGAALCDPLGIVVRPLRVVRRKNDAQAISELLELVRQNEAQKIVLGLPFTQDGGEDINTQKIRLFGQTLSKKTSLPIEYHDESGSTKEAISIISQTKRRHQGQRMEDDAFAAAVILRDYLEHLG